jgi:hypothetical protein
MKIRHFILAAMLVVQARPAFAQCEKATIDSASADPASARVSLAFSQPLADSTASGVVLTVLDANSQAVVMLDANSIQYHSPDQPSKPSSVTFTLKATVAAVHTYFVTAVNLVFDNCPSDKPVTAFSKLIVGKKGEVDKRRPLPFTFSATKGRDDSDLYVSGMIQGAEGTKASYTGDIKAQVQVPIKSATTLGNNRFRAGWWIVPSFDFKASTDPKSDGDCVTIATALTHGFRLPSDLFTWDELAPGFAIESDKQFRAINSLATLRTDLLMRGFGSGNLQLYVQPFFMLAAGDNSRRPLAGAFPGGVVRPAAGLHIYLNLFKAPKPGRKAFIESEYVRRWPLLSEPVFTQDKSGNLNLVSLAPIRKITSGPGWNTISPISLGLRWDTIMENCRPSTRKW